MKKGMRSVKANPVAVAGDQNPKVPAVAVLDGPQEPEVVNPRMYSVFSAKTTCYVEGVYVQGEQEIILCPDAAQRVAKNRNLEFVRHQPPVKPGDMSADPVLGVDPSAGRLATGERLLKQGV